MNNVTFYVAGFTPNAARICQKFIYRDRFGNLIQNLLKHQEDLRIREQDTHPIPFKWINKELVSPKSSNKDVPPPLESSIILAALQNTRYPDALLATVVRRVKTDQDDENDAKGGKYIKLNRVRAGIIKACLNRKITRRKSLWRGTRKTGIRHIFAEDCLRCMRSSSKMLRREP